MPEKRPGSASARSTLMMRISKNLAAFFAAAVLALPGYPCSLDAGAGAMLATTARVVEDERGLAALDQAARELTNPFTLMSVAARPIDIDEGTLAYYRKKLGARVVILLVTRGEGIESRTLPETDQELGVVRTREAVAVARAIGADLFFLNLRDFGYSVSADEAMSVWGHDEAMGRLVRAIRSVRPDVIVTNHGANSVEGIEHAIARLVHEAFDRAASATPALEPGTEAWQTRRMFQRLDWPAGAISQSIVGLDLNEYDAVRGATYAELGLKAHRCLTSYAADLSQMTPDRQKSYYRLTEYLPGDPAARGDNVLESMFDGLSVPERVARSIAPPRVGDHATVSSLADREQLVNALRDKLIEKRAEGDVEQIHSRYGVEFFRVLRYTQTLERALALSIGLDLDVGLSDSRVVAGQKLTARVSLVNHSDRAYQVAFKLPESLSREGQQRLKPYEAFAALPRGATTRDQVYEVPTDAAPTLPHADHLREQTYYGIGTTLPGTQPGEPFGSAFTASVEVDIGQVTISLTGLARFDIARKIEISAIPFVIVSDWSSTREFEFEVRIRNNTPGAVNGSVWVVPLAVSDDDYAPLHVAFAREDEVVTVTLKLKLPLLKPPLSPDILIEFRQDKQAPPPDATRGSGSAAVEVLGSARIPVKQVDFKVAEGVRIAFVAGRDRWLSLALSQLGVQHRELGLMDISRTIHGNAVAASQASESCGELSGYDAIVVDELAYLSRPDLIDCNPCLFKYAQQGGNLIVLGQQPDDLRLLGPRTPLAPFALGLSRSRIAMENAPVSVIDPANQLMSEPNRITSKDFDGWVGERALNVPSQWSAEYTALLESGDPGMERQRGSLLVARNGDGSFVYTTLSLRRQLLRANPGAYRLLANLVSMKSSGRTK